MRHTTRGDFMNFFPTLNSEELSNLTTKKQNFQTEIHKHTHAVISPCLEPFKSLPDAIQRILPYHLCAYTSVDDEQFLRASEVGDEVDQKDIQRLYSQFSELSSRFAQPVPQEQLNLEERLALEEEKFIFGKILNEYNLKFKAEVDKLKTPKKRQYRKRTDKEKTPKTPKIAKAPKTPRTPLVTPSENTVIHKTISHEKTKPLKIKLKLPKHVSLK